MAEVKEAPIDYPGRLRRLVEGVGVLYKTCSPATRLEDCPSENRDGPGKSYVSELRRNLAHSPPSHISKMVLSTVHVGWAYLNGVELDFSRPGKPTDNAMIEAFNARLRAECLNESWFLSLEDAREKIEGWRRHYNGERPHSALGNLAPETFALAAAAGVQ